jgi:hypothetical protein
VRAAALALAALALAGSLSACESSQEENAKLEKIYKREAALTAKRRAIARRGLVITHPSKLVKVLSTSVLHSSEGAAAVVTVQNTSATALRGVPVQITVKNAAGATIYENTIPGLAASLVTIPYVGAHASTVWVDDQVQTSAVPASASAVLGEGERDSQAALELTISGTGLNEGEAEGSLVNHSHTAAHEVVVYALARRAGKLVAAGSGLVADAEPGAGAHFQVPLIGEAKGAQLEVSVGGVA